MKPVRVLIVDDSATMRALLSASLQRDPEIEVVGSVAGAFEDHVLQQMRPARPADILMAGAATCHHGQGDGLQARNRITYDPDTVTEGMKAGQDRPRRPQSREHRP